MRRCQRAMELMAVLALLGAAGVPSSRSAGAERSSGWYVFRGNSALTGVAEPVPRDRPVLVWESRIGESIKSSPVMDDKAVFIGTEDGSVCAMRRSNGEALWRVETEGAVSAPPTLFMDRVLVGSLDGSVYALSVSDGAVVWKYETEGDVFGAANVAEVKTESGKVRRLVLAGSYDTFVYALDADTGGEVWKYGTPSYVNGAVAVWEDKAVFGGCDAHVHVVNLEDGTLAGKVDAGAYIPASPAVSGGVAVVGHYAGSLVCVDLETLSVQWEYRTEGQAAPFLGCPAVGAGRVVAGARDGYVYCVELASGNMMWRFRTAGDVESSPVICGSSVLVASKDGRLYMIDVDTGKEIWRYDIGAPVTGSPAVAGGWVVIGAENGSVYAFRTSDTGKKGSS